MDIDRQEYFRSRSLRNELGGCIATMNEHISEQSALHATRKLRERIIYKRNL